MAKPKRTQPKEPINVFDLVKATPAEPSIGVDWNIKDVQDSFRGMSHEQARQVVLAMKEKNLVQELDSIVLEAIHRVATELFGPEERNK